MLLYHDGNFMQVLEGEPTGIRRLYARISQDRRHRGCHLLMENPIEKRGFAEWSMAFVNWRQSRLEVPDGYSEFLQQGLADPLFVKAPTRAHKLLLSFKNHIR